MQLFQVQGAMHDGLDRRGGFRTGVVVEQQYRDPASGEVLLERQHLPAEPERGAGKQADLGQ